MDYQDFKLSKKEIKVLGTGCTKCKSLERAVEKAVELTGTNATVIKVEDIVEIMQLGVLTTPALIIDGKTVVKGKVPSIDELSRLITE